MSTTNTTKLSNVRRWKHLEDEPIIPEGAGRSNLPFFWQAIPSGVKPSWSLLIAMFYPLMGFFFIGTGKLVGFIPVEGAAWWNSPLFWPISLLRAMFSIRSFQDLMGVLLPVFVAMSGSAIMIGFLLSFASLCVRLYGKIQRKG